jgi:hypothetical protein
MLQDTLRAKHGAIVLAIELYLLGRMDVAVSDRRIFSSVVRVRIIAGCCSVLDAHWESG